MGAAINLATLAYTESDPNSRITITTTNCSGAGLKRDESAKVYYDWGADYFGDFVHDFDFGETTLANGSKLIIWGLSNTADSKDQWAAGIYLQIDATGTSNHAFTLGEIGGSTQAGAGLTAKATRYFRIERNGTTLTAKYATSAVNRVNGVWTETITLTVATTAYRYHYAMSTINEANTTAISVNTINWKGTNMTPGTPFDTAYMAGGATSGNWDSGATWGNAGSVKGTDYPGSASDVFNIDAGDTVTYNVSEANALLGSTIYGTLTFKPDASTKLVFGNAYLVVYGTLNIGTNDSPIQAGYTAELYFTATSDSNSGISQGAAGVVSLVGTDSTGGIYQTYLTADWTSGQTFTVHGDVTGSWLAGMYIVVFKHGVNIGASGAAEYTIASTAANGTDTDITINEAAPGGTWRAGGLAFLSRDRNIIVGKASASYTTQNTNRPQIVSYRYAQADRYIASPVYWTSKHVMFVGVQYFHTGSNYSPVKFDMYNCVVRNSSTPFAKTIGQVYANSVLEKCLFLFFQDMGPGNGNTFKDCIWAFQGGTISALAGANNCQFENCTFYFYSNGSYSFLETVVGSTFKDCDFVALIRVITGSTSARFINCNFGRFKNHSNECSFNNVLNGLSSWSQFDFINCYTPLGIEAGDISTFRSVTGDIVTQAEVTHDDPAGTIGDIRRITYGFCTKVNGTVLRDGGGEKSLEVYAIDKCMPLYGREPILEWTEWEVEAVPQTRTVYIRGGNGGAENWSTFPVAAELFLEVEYLDEVDTAHRAWIKSTAVLADNTTWTAFTVEFTPGRVGPAIYRLFLFTGGASLKLYVDTQLVSS